MSVVGSDVWQNAAARFITGVGRCEHIMPALHQLAGCQSADELISRYPPLSRSLAGTAPMYLVDECTLVTATGHHPLQSADNRTCLVKRSCHQFSDCCFATARPTLWNSLPEQLRQLDITFGQFKRSLKTFVWLVGPRRPVSERSGR